MKRTVAASGDRARLTLDLSARLNDAIDEYADSKGLTKADVLRKAVELLLTADRAAKDGMTIGAWQDDPVTNRRREREFVGPGLP